MAAGKVRVTGASAEFLVRHFTGQEALGSPFSFDLELLTMTRGLKVASFIGQPWTLEIDLPKDKKRYFHGHVTNMLSTGPIGRYASYHVTLRPALWFLSLTSNCRIFPRMSATDVVHELTDKRGVALEASGLSESYPAHRYLVQYRETDLAFISRLMEYEGIYYFFKHDNGSHTMMLADGPGAHEASPGYAEVSFRYAANTSDADDIDEWQHAANALTKKHAINDYDYKKPNAEIVAQLEAGAAGEAEPRDYEHYDFPGAFFDADRGQSLVAIRQQESVANAEVVRGAGNVRGLSPGYTFKLKNSQQDQDGEYLVTHARYECSPGDYEGADSGGGGDEPFFRCTFRAIKKAKQYRPPRVTPKPVISGLQTAKVIGPKGKEIWTDEQGRIRIKFHWQRPEEDAAREEASAIWVRVAQVMAGAGWGALQIPRIGHEVVISFLEGDPDRPIVIGAVYNDANKPPFNPSNGGMVLGMKSDSTPGGGGYNEFSLDDTKGHEMIKIHGQYDMETTIEHDETANIMNNRTVNVTVNHTENVGGDQMVSIDHNQIMQVGDNQTISVGQNQTSTVGANHSMAITGSSTETVALFKQVSITAAMELKVGAAMMTEVGGLLAEAVGLTKTVSVGGSSSEDITGGKSVKTGKALEVSAGGDASVSTKKKMVLKSGNDLAINSGGKGVIEIKDELTIKVGSAQITMKKNGDITIKGNKISVKGDGDTKIKGSKILQNS